MLAPKLRNTYVSLSAPCSALKSLLSLHPGERARIGEVRGAGSVRQRLLDMGLLPEQSVRLERVALGGAPVWIELNGCHLALRREEAEMIWVGDEL